MYFATESVQPVRYGWLAETGRPLFIPMEYTAAGAGVDAGEGRAAGDNLFGGGGSSPRVKGFLQMLFGK